MSDEARNVICYVKSGHVYMLIFGDTDLDRGQAVAAAGRWSNMELDFTWADVATIANCVHAKQPEDNHESA